jgi:glycosyltransferase involved in cell wall biosynthesis
MISIITVVRNGASTIEETILSVINQDYPHIEFIIVDGVSTDGTLEIIEKYADRISIVKSEPDNGIYDAMNKGVGLASGDWIYFLGADDVLYSPSTLSHIFSATPYENYDVVYGDVLFLQSQIIYDGKFDYEKLCNRSICHQAIFYRKEVFEEFGRFDTKYITAADYVFNAKAFSLKAERWLYVNEIVAIFNELGISKSRDQKSRDDNFSIRYDNFRPYVSKYTLSRIFWSSFFRYLSKHKAEDSMKYISLVKKDIGLIKLMSYLPLIFIRKIRS